MAGTIDDEMRDYRHFVLPYSHAAGYARVPDVELVAFADVDRAKCDALGARYGVTRLYTEYREMILAEKPDIVSICTPGTSHAEIAVFAARNGARAIYCEKAMACSPAEADAMVEAVETQGVKFNMGTLRRWSSGTRKAREIIASGAVGPVRTVTSYSVGSLLHSASHFIDLLLLFADDAAPDWVQGTVLSPEFDSSVERWDKEVDATGIVHFGNGVWGYLMSSPRWAQFEVLCGSGSLRTRNDCLDWTLEVARKRGKATEYSGRPFPRFSRESSTVSLIRDLVHALDTDGPTRQGVRTAALSVEIAFGIVESHRRGGARVSLPLENRRLWMRSH
jgi:predicted dehydrogenase